MRFFYPFVLVMLFFAAAEVSAQDVTDDAGPEQEDAGSKITRPGAGEENKRLIDDYTGDHGSSCHAVAASSGSGRRSMGWVSVLGLTGAVLLRARRRSMLATRRAAHSPGWCELGAVDAARVG